MYIAYLPILSDIWETGRNNSQLVRVNWRGAILKMRTVLTFPTSNPSDGSGIGVAGAQRRQI